MVLKESLSKYSIFSKLNEEQLVEAVKYSQYLILQPKDQIFNIGDSLEYFYVIVKGSVSQYCTEHSYEMAKSRQKYKPDMVLATAEAASQKVIRIKILSEGDYLGEQALLNTEQNHQSALQAIAEAPEVHLLAININMYKQYLQTASRNNLINDISVMQSNNMFNKWEFDMIRLLYFFSVKQTFYNGQTVFKENDLSKAVFIVLKGEFGIYKTFQESEGKGIKQQGNKKHNSDEEGSNSDDEGEDHNTFRNRIKDTFKEAQSSETESQDDILDDQNGFANSFSKSEKGKPTSSLSQRKLKQPTKKSNDHSLDYIDEMQNSETDYLKPSSKVLDHKQIKSLNQIHRTSEDQIDNLQGPLSSKKVSRKSKVFLYPNKDDSVTPKMINTQPKNKLFQLYSLGLNQIFGEEDVMKKQKRSFTVKCNSYGGGLLLIIRKNIFNLSLLANSSSEIYLKQNLEMKEQRFNSRVKLVQENISKYKNYFFENNDNATPKNPLRMKRKLVEKDCINIDDFMKASQKQVVSEKSNKLYDQSLFEKQKFKKDNQLFAAELINEKINTFSNPHLKKIDLFNFKNDICKVENPPSIHAFFENELKKKQQTHNNTQQHQSNIATIVSNSQPNTQRGVNLFQIKSDTKIVKKVQQSQQFHKPKLSNDYTLKVTNDPLAVSILSNNSALYSQGNAQSSTQMNSYNNISNSLNPPSLKRRQSKSDPHIKLPPSIELLNKMGQSGLLGGISTPPEVSNNPILAQKDQLKREILLKQQYQKIEQANQPQPNPSEKKGSVQFEQNTRDEFNNQKTLSRRSKAQQETGSGSITYIPPQQNIQHVPKMNSDSKPVKKNIFLETFTKGFFKNMKGVYYKNFSNQQGSLNSYAAIQESLAKHVLDPSLKSFLQQNPGILQSQDKQNEFLRVNPVTDKPILKNNPKSMLKSNPEFNQEDFAPVNHQYGEYDSPPLRRPASAKPQKGTPQQGIIKFNLFRQDQHSATSYKFDINKIKEQNSKNSGISPDKKSSPNKYKRTYSAVELETNNDQDGSLEDAYGQQSQHFDKSEENSKTSPVKAYFHNTAQGFYSNKEKNNSHTPSININKVQNDAELQHTQPVQTTSVQKNIKNFRKQASLQHNYFEKQLDHHHHQPQQHEKLSQPPQLLEKIPLQLPNKQQVPQTTQVTYSTHNFFKASPPVHQLKSMKSQFPSTQMFSKTMSNLSPEIPKKSAIKHIFGTSSQPSSQPGSMQFNAPHLSSLINLNNCNNEVKQEIEEQDEDVYKNQHNDLFRQKIENDKNLIKMTNLFTQQSPPKKPYKTSM